jgi:hypothetical protein
VKIVTCQRGELDFSNLGGVITAIVDQYGAREESVKLADRSLSGKRLAISQGKKQGGLPYGYDREILDETGSVVRRVGPTETFHRPIQRSSRLVVSSDDRAVEAVREMFEAIADGASCGAVARQLNRQGTRTMFGKRFNATSVRRTVTNPVYVGTIVAGKRRRGKFRSLFDDGGLVCENAHEPLVSCDLFDRSQRMLRRNHKPSKAPTPGRYLLTGIVYLGDGRRLQGCTMNHADRKIVRRYYALPPREFEDHPEEHDRPCFRADTIEQGVLAKLQAFMADERTKRAIRSEITRRTRKADANVGRLESQRQAVRAKIERGTESLALANPEDIPGISKLLVGWRDQETNIKDKLRQARGEVAPSSEALEVISRLDELLERLSEADREKLSFAIRQTVKRVSLRRERRGVGTRHHITLWDGVIELRDDLGVAGIIPLTDDDIPSPGRWREVADFIRQRSDVVYFRDVCEHVGLKGSCVSRLLAQAVLSGMVRNLGHQKGWIAAK